VNIKKIKNLIKLLEDSNINEIEVKGVFQKIRVCKYNPGERGSLPGPIEEKPEEGGTIRTEESVGELEDNLAPVKSPIVGTFYRRPSPNSPPYVEVGSSVKKGDVLCIVEAMKVMNEIESDIDGVVKKILPEDGSPVEYGETLFLIEPLSS